jgi:hypothetical protein
MSPADGPPGVDARATGAGEMSTGECGSRGRPNHCGIWSSRWHGAGRIVRRVARRAGITKTAGPHTLRHTFITAALDAGVPLRDVPFAAVRFAPRSWSRCRTACAEGGDTVAVEFVAVGHAAGHGHDQGQGAAGHQRPGASGEGAVAGLQS